MRGRTLQATVAGLVLAAWYPVHGNAIARSQPEAEVPAAGRVGARTVTVLQSATLHFQPDSAAKYLAPGQRVEDNGRVVRTTVDLPEIEAGERITAHVTLEPIAKSEREMFDRWDRAGNVRLAQDDLPDLEVVRFITSYGGRTEHTVDVTHLAPLLRGRRSFEAFVDTWTSPGWRIHFELRYEPGPTDIAPSWVRPVYATDSFNRQDMPDGVQVRVEIPSGLQRVVLKYFTTGHCTDGVDADEFISKANVISVDGVVVARFHPWRDDCRRFRERNPYTSHWADGSWSSDYSRSGWCPGVEVLPVEFDLSDHLTPGTHVVRFVVEDMRPKDEQGHFGYWRISAHLVGWNRKPELWRNP